MNFRYEVQVYNDEKWYQNAVVFATREEADMAGSAKFAAWTSCAGYRVTETPEPANYHWVSGVGLQAILAADGPVTPQEVADRA